MQMMKTDATSTPWEREGYSSAVEWVKTTPYLIQQVWRADTVLSRPVSEVTEEDKAEIGTFIDASIARVKAQSGNRLLEEDNWHEEMAAREEERLAIFTLFNIILDQ